MKIIGALLILISFASCKKVITDDYKIKYYSDIAGMNIYYLDYSFNYKDTFINATDYSVSFVVINRPLDCVTAEINTNGVNSNLKIEIYRNKKLVCDTSTYSNRLNLFYCE
jgi:hypothetical protein